jgi:hypothetical protein
LRTLLALFLAAAVAPTGTPPEYTTDNPTGEYAWAPWGTSRDDLTAIDKNLMTDPNRPELMVDVVNPAFGRPTTSVSFTFTDKGLVAVVVQYDFNSENVAKSLDSALRSLVQTYGRGKSVAKTREGLLHVWQTPTGIVVLEMAPRKDGALIFHVAYINQAYLDSIDPKNKKQAHQHEA